MRRPCTLNRLFGTTSNVRSRDVPSPSSSRTFNPGLGTVERASRSFGAFFVERAVTGGRGRASAGVTFRFSSFGRLDGFDLRDGSFVTTANQFVDEAAPFDQESLTLRVRTTTATGFVNVGLSDRLDLSVAVPVVWLSLEGERVDDFRGRRTVQASASADIAGIGDVAVRGKWRVGGERGSGVALGGEIRLPTGREEDLLGSGKVSFKGQAIASVEGPVAGVSFNAGYAGGGVATQFDYGVGMTLAPASRFTLTWEAFGAHVARRGAAGARLLAAPDHRRRPHVPPRAGRLDVQLVGHGVRVQVEPCRGLAVERLIARAHWRSGSAECPRPRGLAGYAFGR